MGGTNPQSPCTKLFATITQSLVTAFGTVYQAAQAAGVSRNTVYRWRQEDLEFAEAWYEAHENAVDVVENVMYQQAVGGNTLAGIFYLKAHRPKYRDRLKINVEQVQSEIDEMMERFRENPGLLNPVSRMMPKRVKLI